jgi:protein-L-isoaspartate(D-aspartate) O-methyltransferase
MGGGVNAIFFRMKRIFSYAMAAFGAASCSGGVPEPERFREAREEMVRTQVIGRGVKDERVLAAMRKVPRHVFMPREVRARAYDDSAVPIGHAQTISQPYIVAFMTEVLALKPEDRVLEIGTGSGYQAAIFAEMGKEVFSIEIVDALGKQAAMALKEAGYGQVKTRIGDGFRGWQEEAPFDAIMVTCAPDAIPQPLIDQLADGGRMIIPVGPQGAVQELVLVTNTAGALERKSILPVRFVPMTGEAER